MKAVTRLFDSQAQAEAAVTELEAAGLGHGRLSLIAPEKTRILVAHHAAHSEALEGAAQLGGAGVLVGGGAGFLASLGMLVVPGLGPVFAAGWMVATAVGAAMGAVAGVAAGGVLGALDDAGHSRSEIDVYAEGVRRGGVLLSIKPHNAAEQAKAAAIMQRHGGADAAERGAAYRLAGWDGKSPILGPRIDEPAAVVSDDTAPAFAEEPGDPGMKGGFGSSVTSL